MISMLVESKSRPFGRPPRGCCDLARTSVTWSDRPDEVSAARHSLSGRRLESVFVVGHAEHHDVPVGAAEAGAWGCQDPRWTGAVPPAPS